MPIQTVLSKDNTGNKLKAPIKVWTDDIDETSMQQLRNLGSLPFVFKHISVMPDVHAGKGSTIGSVIATKGAITPATVGVDLGCGMSAYKIPGLKPEHLDGKLKTIRSKIEKTIPVGFAKHKLEEGFDRLALGEKEHLLDGREAVYDRAMAIEGHDKLLRAVSKAGNQLGSLGGGNHFIEVCVSKKNEVWLMLHSGSRGVGNMIAQYHIQVAKGLMKKAFINLPDSDLSYFWEGTTEFDHYIADMLWAQEFAYFNRRSMGRLALDCIISALDLRDVNGQELKSESIEFVDCHHNYVAKECHFEENVWVTRKGAVRARQGDVGIIPGSMGAKSFIVTGRGSQESFCSCSHGAGRKMSRTQAKKVFSKKDLIEQTSGVECRKDGNVIDEIPGAYKDIDEVMSNQTDLVEVLEELRQVICIKG
ncbi:MAG: RtcB family protein [Pseudobacteriovorax sp.]|nr:RtcB family protein [Pseudobacteriovorax sp.]